MASANVLLRNENVSGTQFVWNSGDSKCQMSHVRSKEVKLALEKAAAHSGYTQWPARINQVFTHIEGNHLPHLTGDNNLIGQAACFLAWHATQVWKLKDVLAVAQALGGHDDSITDEFTLGHKLAELPFSVVMENPRAKAPWVAIPKVIRFRIGATVENLNAINKMRELGRVRSSLGLPLDDLETAFALSRCVSPQVAGQQLEAMVRDKFGWKNIAGRSAAGDAIAPGDKPVEIKFSSPARSVANTVTLHLQSEEVGTGLHYAVFIVDNQGRLWEFLLSDEQMFDEVVIAKSDYAKQNLSSIRFHWELGNATYDRWTSTYLKEVWTPSAWNKAEWSQGRRLCLP